MSETARNVEAMSNDDIKRTLNGSEVSRRRFLQMLARASAAGFAASTMQSVHQICTADPAMQREVSNAINAHKFEKTFNLELDPRRPLSLLSGNFNHPDNRAARDTLQSFLPHASGKADDDVREITSGQEGMEKIDGTVVVIGGANSTPEMRKLLGFKGEDDRNLERGKGAIPLVYSGISSEQEVLRDAPKAGFPPKLTRIMRLNPPKWVTQMNWGVKNESEETVTWLDGKKDSKGNYLTQEVTTNNETGETAALPVMGEDYAILTKVPNFLDSEFAEKHSAGRMPCAFVIEGMTGVATAAMELLSEGSEKAKAILARIENSIQKMRSYQILLRFDDIHADNGFHKAHNAELIRSVSLDKEIEAFIQKKLSV